MARDVRLLSEPFIPGQFVGPFTNAHPGLGGVCTFVGEVRSDDSVQMLELMHYAPLTLPGIRATTIPEGASSSISLSAP